MSNCTIKRSSTGFFACFLGKMCLYPAAPGPCSWGAGRSARNSPVGSFVCGSWDSAGIFFLFIIALCPVAAGGGEGLPHRACWGGVLCGWGLPGGGVQWDQPGDCAAAEPWWGTDVQHWQYLQPFLHSWVPGDGGPVSSSRPAGQLCSPEMPPRVGVPVSHSVISVMGTSCSALHFLSPPNSSKQLCPLSDSPSVLFGPYPVKRLYALL